LELLWLFLIVCGIALAVRLVSGADGTAAPRGVPTGTPPRPATASAPSGPSKGPIPVPSHHLCAGSVIQGPCWVIDGDTIVIGKQNIRLAGIDAPELDHPWGQKSKYALVALCRGQTIKVRVTGELSHNRVVGVCYLPDGRDLAAELVRMGLAVDWPKYSGGRYRHLEVPGVRRRLWRCDARQNGRFPPAEGNR